LYAYLAVGVLVGLELNASGPELPMAPADCTLDRSGLIEQVDRYRRLGATATSIDASARELLISFSDDVDLDVLRDTIAIERGCCSFFTLDYDASEGRLSIRVEDPTRSEALRALASALQADSADAVIVPRQAPDR
jgi:hypothetical protein